MTNRSALPRARSVQGRGQCYKCIERSGERRRGVERGGEGMGRGMGLSIADIPLAAFRRDDRLGKIDLCRGSSRWMGQSTKSISHHPHDIGPLSPFSARFYPLYALYGADRYVRSPLIPDADQSRSVHRGMLMRSRNEIVSRILFMIICLHHQKRIYAFTVGHRCRWIMDRYGDFFYFFPFHVGNVLKWHGKNFKFGFSIEMFSILEKYFSFFLFFFTLHSNSGKN